MLGSKKRDYKTEDRKIRSVLKRHKERMDELIADGMTPDAASKQAYQEIKRGLK